MNRYASLYEDMSVSYLKKKYDEFNKAFFDGRLPPVILRFSSRLKHAGGIASIRVLRTKEGLVPRKETMSITISTVFLRTDHEIDAMLLHEMAHIAMYEQGDFRENHGIKFKALIAEIGQKWGHTVPETDDTRQSELSQAPAKPIGVIVYRNMSTKKVAAYAIVKPQVLAEPETVTDRYFLNNSGYQVEMYLTLSPEWHRKAIHMPVQTGRARRIQMYMLQDQALDDALKQEKPIYMERPPMVNVS